MFITFGNLGKSLIFMISVITGHEHDPQKPLSCTLDPANYTKKLKENPRYRITPKIHSIILFHFELYTFRFAIPSTRARCIRAGSLYTRGLVAYARARCIRAGSLYTHGWKSQKSIISVYGVLVSLNGRS